MAASSPLIKPISSGSRPSQEQADRSRRLKWPPVEYSQLLLLRQRLLLQIPLMGGYIEDNPVRAFRERYLDNWGKGEFQAAESIFSDRGRAGQIKRPGERISADFPFRLAVNVAATSATAESMT